MLIFFMCGSELQELEQLMRLVPIFLQSVFVNKKSGPLDQLKNVLVALYTFAIWNGFKMKKARIKVDRYTKSR